MILDTVQFVLIVISGILLASTAALCMYRVIVGPSILDRMIASDVIVTTFILVIGMEMIVNEHSRTIPLMVILAATAIFGTVAVSRFVTKPVEEVAPGPTVPSSDNPAAPQANEPRRPNPGGAA